MTEIKMKWGRRGDWQVDGSWHWVRLNDNDKPTHAKLIGVKQARPEGDAVLAFNGRHLVLKSKGRRENPGSRFSGLVAYYPPETTVLEVIGERDDGVLACRVLIAWENTRKATQ